MQIKEPKDLLILKPFPEDIYEKYSLTSLTAYVIYWLYEWSLPSSLENISVANYKLFPSKFAMIGWPEFPDLTRVNRSVLQMRPKYRNLASSITTEGVFLNAFGKAEAEKIISEIGTPLHHKKSTGQKMINMNKILNRDKRPRTIHPEDKVNKIKTSLLFKLYKSDQIDKSEIVHLISMLGVYDHTPPKEKKRIFREFELSAKEINDNEALDFLKKIKERFSMYIS